jgi:serine/threonine protein kinase
LGPLEENLIAFILREVLQGLDYLHSKWIAYGNMSTHHILFSVASGSLEIRLDHTHAVIDDLEARTSEIDKYIQVSDA